jgi:hypothetical protein
MVLVLKQKRNGPFGVGLVALLIPGSSDATETAPDNFNSSRLLSMVWKHLKG